MAGDVIGRADYQVGADQGPLVDDLKSAEGKIAQSGANVQKTATSTGAAWKAGAAVAAVGFGLMARGADQMETAAGQFQAATGKSRAEGQAFAKDMNALVGTGAAVGHSFEEITATGAEVARQFGLTGKANQDLTSQALMFAKVTGSDAVDAVNSLDDTLDAFHEPASKATDLMDMLVASNQKYGTEVGPQTVEMLGKMAPALQAMGMGLDDGVGLLNMFEASGLDAAGAMRGLNTAVKNLPPGTTLDDFIQHLIDMKTKGIDPTQEAIAVFGAKAGVGIANAITPGMTGLDAYKVSMQDAQGATEDAGNSMLTTKDHLQMMFDTLGANVRGLGDTIGPALSGLGGLTTALLAMPNNITGPLTDGLKGIWSKVGAAVAPAAAAAGAVIGEAQAAASTAAATGADAIKNFLSKFGLMTGEKVAAATVAGTAAGAAEGEAEAVAAGTAAAAATPAAMAPAAAEMATEATAAGAAAGTAGGASMAVAWIAALAAGAIVGIKLGEVLQDAFIKGDIAQQSGQIIAEATAAGYSQYAATKGADTVGIATALMFHQGMRGADLAAGWQDVEKQFFEGLNGHGQLTDGMVDAYTGAFQKAITDGKTVAEARAAGEAAIQEMAVGALGATPTLGDAIDSGVTARLAELPQKWSLFLSDQSITVDPQTGEFVKFSDPAIQSAYEAGQQIMDMVASGVDENVATAFVTAGKPMSDALYAMLNGIYFDPSTTGPLAGLYEKLNIPQRLALEWSQSGKFELEKALPYALQNVGDVANAALNASIVQSGFEHGLITEDVANQWYADSAEAASKAGTTAGENADHSLAKALVANSNEVSSAADKVRQDLQNALEPEKEAATAAGRKTIQLFRKGITSENDQTVQDAQQLGLNSLSALEKVVESGHGNAKDAKAIGIYFDQLVASGMDAKSIAVALAADGVGADTIATLTGYYPEYDNVGKTWSAKVATGITSADNKIETAATDATAPLRDTSLADKGDNIGTAWMDALAKGIRGGKATLEYAINKATLAMRGQSPPPVGPLKDIDVKGANVADAWIGGMVGRIKDGAGMVDNALRAYNLSPAFGSAATMAGVGLGGGGMTLSVGDININVTGVDTADAPGVAERIGEAVKGALNDVFDQAEHGTRLRWSNSGIG